MVYEVHIYYCFSIQCWSIYVQMHSPNSWKCVPASVFMHQVNFSNFPIFNYLNIIKNVRDATNTKTNSPINDFINSFSSWKLNWTLVFFVKILSLKICVLNELIDQCSIAYHAVYVYSNFEIVLLVIFRSWFIKKWRLWYYLFLLLNS